MKGEGLWRSFPTPFSVLDMDVGPGNAIVLNAIEPSRDLAGFPLRWVDSTGRTLVAFGEEQTEVIRMDTRARIHYRRVLTTGNGVWAARTSFRYELTRWDIRGTRVSQAPRTADWFPPQSDRVEAPRAEPTPPQPGIAALGVINDTLGVVLGSALRSDWKRGMKLVAPREASQAASHVTPNVARWEVDDPTKVFDSVLDVFDLRSGRPLVTRRLSGTIPYVPSAGTLAALSFDDDGEVVITLLRIAVAPET
ncbi:MAG: hypothetical protein IPK85_06365 [Gemmatimonadetes bacterium]|nr:hypothetical protein [Gemmatimonadota bacterium]